MRSSLPSPSMGEGWVRVEVEVFQDHATACVAIFCCHREVPLGAVAI